MLVDDILNYIGPTLEKHKGCDILDLNPGAGLWSQKVHDFLQPRSHVLVEPQYDRFKSFLEPLLNAPDSKYSLVQKDPCHLETYGTLVSDGVFPNQVFKSQQDPDAQKPNNSFLVIGSLAWDPKLPGLGFDSMAKQMFNHFVTASHSNTLIHAFGLARTLLWVQQEDFSHLLAESMAGMQKGNRYLEMTHNVNVIVNGGHTPRKSGRGSIGRDPQYEIESTIRALQTGRSNGIELPSHRRGNVHRFAEDIATLTNGTGRIRGQAMHEYLAKQHIAGISAVGLLPGTFVEHYDQESELNREYPELHIPPTLLPPGSKARSTAQYKEHPDFAIIQKFSKKCAVLQNILRIKEKTEATADLGEEIYLLECKILEMDDGPEKDELMKKLDELEQTWHHAIENAPVNYIMAPAAEIDNRLALRTPPEPRLQWDRRPFEPLVMSPSEVWPQARLSLISAEPIPMLAGQTVDWFEWVQDFVFGLFRQNTSPINIALDKMQHGLSDIIKDCPSLRDPKQGGRLQMHHLRVSMLTMPMIEEMVTAYKAWPFKAPGSDHSKFFRVQGGKS